jgi:hypothetical protein
MTAYALQTTSSSPTIGQVGRSWLPGLLRASRDAWIDYRSARSPSDRRHRLGLFVLYLSAVILPGGALLVLLRWLWLRLHM